MEISLLTVGKTTQDYVISGLLDFTQRLRRYIDYQIICVEDVKKTKSISPDVQKEKEGELLLRQLSPSDFCVLLDEHGKQFSSMEFASFIQKIMASGRKRAVFVVGGPYGFSKAVYDRADALLSLSKMTFTHEMVRLFFTEQIYRALTILRGEPYHHE